MSVAAGFDDLQEAVDVPFPNLQEARRRRRVFVDAFKSCDDVEDGWGSGSLARSTYKDPIHDVDVVAIFDAAEHSDWGQPGSSADAALQHTRNLAKKLLGSEGSESVEIRRTRVLNHAVKCFLDDPDEEDAFTVDVTPALRRTAGGILIPERANERWIASDPQHLIEQVSARHADWDEFRRLVRVLKRWNADHGHTMKSLVIEVLALTHLRKDTRPAAIQRFFTAAADAVLSPVEDPAELCGEIQPEMDRYEARDRLSTAGDIAWRAIGAEHDGDTDRATCLWRDVFGDIFPEPDGGCADHASATAAAGVVATNIAFPRRPVRDAPQG